jgi:hypothetical protein
VNRYILYLWAGAGWCVGLITAQHSRKLARHQTPKGHANSVVYFECDKTEAHHTLCFDRYNDDGRKEEGEFITSGNGRDKHNSRMMWRPRRLARGSCSTGVRAQCRTCDRVHPDQVEQLERSCEVSEPQHIACHPPKPCNRRGSPSGAETSGGPRHSLVTPGQGVSRFDIRVVRSTSERLRRSVPPLCRWRSDVSGHLP